MVTVESVATTARSLVRNTGSRWLSSSTAGASGPVPMSIARMKVSRSHSRVTHSPAESLVITTSGKSAMSAMATVSLRRTWPSYRSNQASRVCVSRADGTNWVAVSGLCSVMNAPGWSDTPYGHGVRCPGLAAPRGRHGGPVQ